MAMIAMTTSSSMRVKALSLALHSEKKRMDETSENEKET
jgi:hypothetical protein